MRNLFDALGFNSSQQRRRNDGLVMVGWLLVARLPPCRKLTKSLSVQAGEARACRQETVKIYVTNSSAKHMSLRSP
jgi:hypothetical protein